MVTDGNDALSPALPHPSARLPGTAGQGSAAPQSADLRVIHLRLPAPYLTANWPLSHAALSSDGMDIAVAGRYGLALYSRRSARWRLFGDVSQEREIAVHVSAAPMLIHFAKFAWYCLQDMGKSCIVDEKPYKLTTELTCKLLECALLALCM